MTPDGPKVPLYMVLATIAALWGISNVGYYLMFPVLGFSLDFNSSPIAISVYFLFWAVVSVVYFWNLFSKWLRVNFHIWIYGAFSLLFAALASELLYLFSSFPVLQGPRLAPYTDILFATPWYFLPRSIDILVQQILLTTLILELHFRFRTIGKVIVGYIVCFGGAHVLLFALTGAPIQYAVIMTSAAVMSALMFPQLILKVRGGFVYAYAIHLVFYILFAMATHTWPPPGYYGI